MISAAEKFVREAEMIVCGAKPIAEATAIRVSLAEKIESWTDLMAGGIEVLVSHSSTISDDAEIILKETELIVPRRPRTARACLRSYHYGPMKGANNARYVSSGKGGP